MSEIPAYVDGDGVEHQLPWKWEICGRCHGNGTHGNPAFDGLSADDEFWHDDEDFLPDYLEGKYDVACEAGCESGKVRAVDEARMSPEQVAAWEAWCKEEAEYAQMCRMERMMGA